MKKGFTLIELLAVITIMAVIIAFTMPAVVKRVNEKKGQVNEVVNMAVEAAVNKYLDDNASLYAGQATFTINTSDLVDNDYLDKSIINTGNYCTVSVTRLSNGYRCQLNTCTKDNTSSSIYDPITIK